MAEQEKNQPRKKQEIDYPLVLLCVLLTVVGVLVFVGYDYLIDDTPTTPLTLADASETTEPAVAEGAAERTSTEKTAESVVKKKASPARSDAAEKKNSSAAAESSKKEKKEDFKKFIPAGGKTITHTVKAGETFSSVARRYNLSKQALRGLNPKIEAEQDIKAGVTKLNVKVKAVHTVGPGDILSKVADKYGVSKEKIMAANGKTKDYAQRGETLIIPFP